MPYFSSSIFWIVLISRCSGFEITENQVEQTTSAATNSPSGHLKVPKLNDTTSNNGSNVLATLAGISLVQRLLSSQLLLRTHLVLLNFNDSSDSSSRLLPLWLHHDNLHAGIKNQSTINTEPATVTEDEGIETNFSETNRAEIFNSPDGNKQDISKENEDHDYKETHGSIPIAKGNHAEPQLRITYHSYRREWETAKKCVQYSERNLYQKLVQSGMLNQWFMANTPEDAGRNFVQSYRNSFESGFHYSDASSLPLAEALPDDESIDESFECNDLCEIIIRKLNEAVAKEQNHTQLLGSPVNEGELPTFGSESRKSMENNCQLGTFIPAGECIPQGAEEVNEHNKLCTSCHGVYMLNKMCFPRFINAVTCHGLPAECIFDRISAQAHGSCYMRMLTLKVLHNRGSEKCQEWYYEYIEVPASCECYMDPKSLFLSAIKP